MKYSKYFKYYIEDYQAFQRLNIEGRRNTKEGDSLLNEMQFSWNELTPEEKDTILQGPTIDPYVPYPLLEE